MWKGGAQAIGVSPIGWREVEEEGKQVRNEKKAHVRGMEVTFVSGCDNKNETLFGEGGFM